MKKFVAFFFGILILLFTHASLAQDTCVPPPGGRCLTKLQIDKVEQALKELDEIHKAPASISTTDTITIVHDWQGRVYVNGGTTVPLRFKLTLGSTIDRDMAVTLPTQVYYRVQPPDPMFRLRIRAQGGILVPQLVQTVGGDKQAFWDIWVSFDFFHLGPVNLAANAGVKSLAFGPGLDLTKNFGVTAGYAFIYDGLKSSVYTGVYFAF